MEKNPSYFQIEAVESKDTIPFTLYKAENRSDTACRQKNNTSRQI